MSDCIQVPQLLFVREHHRSKQRSINGTIIVEHLHTECSNDCSPSWSIWLNHCKRQTTREWLIITLSGIYLVWIRHQHLLQDIPGVQVVWKRLTSRLQYLLLDHKYAFLSTKASTGRISFSVNPDIFIYLRNLHLSP